MRSLNDLARECYEISKSKGWYDDNRTFGDIIALIHSEASEALEEYRSGHLVNIIYYNSGPFDNPNKPEGVPIELADLLIRVLDFCYSVNMDIDKAFRVKMDFNKSRPHRHGGKVI